jgi:DNA-binding PadR family transcriptional regulator
VPVAERDTLLPVPVPAADYTFRRAVRPETCGHERGTIYPLLSRLRRDGLVESVWRESAEGPPRRYYHLTDAGRAALAGFAHEWSRFRDAVDHFMEGEA